MIFTETAKRPMKISKEEYTKRYNAMIVPYCNNCATMFDLPKNLRATDDIEEDEPCGICSFDDPIVGRLMRDNQLLEKVLNGEQKSNG